MDLRDESAKISEEENIQEHIIWNQILEYTINDTISRMFKKAKERTQSLEGRMNEQIEEILNRNKALKEISQQLKNIEQNLNHM